jgi:tetratricopeptide (TPR) repeat protein
MIRKLLFLLVLFATPANAQWLEASSDHFVIYSDQKERDVRNFAERLERYHNAMAEVLQQRRPKPSPSNRVTIYVVRDQAAISKLTQGNKNIAGFYIPRAGGSTAFVSRVDSDIAKASFSEIILLHEYAHHFLISISDETYPHWLNEGMAEFFGTAKFDKDGSVSVGLPAKHRNLEMVYADTVPIEQLIDTSLYFEKKSKFYDSFYGRSWLLFHYLFFNAERSGQLSDYLIKVRSGLDELDAARAAFGDLNKLDRDLDVYYTRRQWNYRQIMAEAVKPGPIAITPLSVGASAMMKVRIQSKRGVDDKAAKVLLPEAQAIAARYPADPFVQGALAEAEFDAGNDLTAIAAADRALAANANELNALVQKGYAMARTAKANTDNDAAWSDVRKQFVKINKIEPDHPIPLIEYYESFVKQGVAPPKVAVDGLFWAHRLAPFDQGVRWSVANEQFSAGQFRKALETLAPLANNPHQSDLADKAKELIAKAKDELVKAGQQPAVASAGS